jgi:hypothetical protein
MSIEKSSELFIPAPARFELSDPLFTVTEGAVLVNNGNLPKGGGYVETPDGIGAFDYVRISSQPEGDQSMVVSPLPKSYVTGPEGENKLVTEPEGVIVFWDLEKGIMRVICRVVSDTGFRPRGNNSSIVLPSGIRQVFYSQPASKVYGIVDVSENTKVTVALPRRCF